MKKTIVLAVALMVASVSMAAEALWLRYPAISPDGNSVAFTYMGDIYVVDSKGGEARLLVTDTKMKMEFLTKKNIKLYYLMI